MASAFWILEDGRGFAKRWTDMVSMLNLISIELKGIEGAEVFYKYLEPMVYREENGDIPNGYGGFIRNEENIMFNFDLRSFAPGNRGYFWKAVQNALDKMKSQNDGSSERLKPLFVSLLDMHNRIEIGEDPMLLNDMLIVDFGPTDKLGPGW